MIDLFSDNARRNPYPLYSQLRSGDSAGKLVLPMIGSADLLTRFKSFELATDQPWKPRNALNVHGPAHRPIRFELDRRISAL